jgi:hypothetical protein
MRFVCGGTFGDGIGKICGKIIYPSAGAEAEELRPNKKEDFGVSKGYDSDTKILLNMRQASK